MKKRTRVIMIILSAVVLVLAIVLIRYLNPKQIFERKFEFALPKSAEIVEYEYTFFGEDYFAAKITFAEEDYGYMEENLFAHLWPMNTEGYDIDRYIVSFKDEYSWWDLDPDNVVIAYEGMDFGRFVKTIMVTVFCAINEDGQYAIYVIH